MSIKLRKDQMNNRGNKKYNQKGIGLVETILALGLAIIVITSMVSLALFTLRASLQNKLTLAGTQIVNEELELVRAYRDSNTWADFITGMENSNCFSPNYCYMSSVATIVSGKETINAGTNEEVLRGFMLTDQSGGSLTVIRVAANASWQLGGEIKNANNYTELSNWRER